MRIHLLAAAACLLIAGASSSPVLITAQSEASSAGPAPEVLEAGKVQEETQGVFQKEAPAEKEAEPPAKALETDAKPIVTPPDPQQKETDREMGRQSGDDDDDDDDDLDLGVDDDDDEDDDDDDDGDYSLDGFFDDLLGDDDDDDDDEDDDDTPAASVNTQPAPQPVVEPAVLTPDEQLNAAEEIEYAGETGTDGTVIEAEDEGVVLKDPTDTDESVSSTVHRPIVVQPVPAYEDETEDADEDDDDDDDDDITDLAVDDDDDDDDDDEDDDDETDFEDVIDARKARAMQTRIPAVYIAKYNRFVDNIIGRINKILARSYDPVRVKLQTPEVKKNKGSNKKSTKKNKKKTKTPGKNQHMREPDQRNKMAEMPIARSTESEAREPEFVLISKATDSDNAKVKNGTVELRARPVKKKNSNKNGSNSSGGNGSNKKKNTKGKTKATKTQRARATLYGLSTIRRDGDVSVNMKSDYTNVKTNFILGPLTLRVEKEFGRGAKKQLKSATATTTEMFGRLNLRIVHGGAATLHTIRVLQPKQVRVESKDNHDKTREYVWRRSSHIAHVVSNKLAKAARSMLKPPPTN